MINIYVPIELLFEGITYPGNSYQEVPEKLADFISSDPKLSKMKPPKQVDKFAYLKAQPLDFLTQQLEAREVTFKSLLKEIKKHQAMGSQPPKNIIINFNLAQSDLEEFAAYVQPLIQKRQLEEADRRSRLIAKSNLDGTTLTFTKDGKVLEDFTQAVRKFDKDGNEV